jgi:hypothetical protein
MQQLEFPGSHRMRPGPRRETPHNVIPWDYLLKTTPDYHTDAVRARPTMEAL